jgi:hypothetical protein
MGRRWIFAQTGGSGGLALAIGGDGFPALLVCRGARRGFELDAR